MNVDVTPKDVFLDSLARCRQRPAFLAAFYRRFMASSDEVRQAFEDTDFRHQHRMLARSLELTAAATAGDASGLRELTDRATTHDRHHLNVRPELYDLWLDAMIETARETDPFWDDEVEQAWRIVIGYAVRHMQKYY